MVDTNLRYSRITHITVLHPEPAKAARFVRDTMNANECDKELCARIRHLVSQEDNECERVTAGGLTFQFMKPTPALPGSQEFFAEHGPKVYSYALEVDDVDAAVDALVNKGGAKLVAHAQGADRLDWNQLFEGQGDPIDFAVVDAREKCGLIFDITKKNDQIPCYTGVRFPTDIGCFMHSEVCVNNTAEAAEWLCGVMGGERIEQHISSRIGAWDPDAIGDVSMFKNSQNLSGEAFKPACEHVLIGGFVFQLISPIVHLTGWDEHLARHGNNTILICYHVRELVRTVKEQLRIYEENGAFELVEEGREHGNSWEFRPVDLYGPDGDDTDHLYNCIWVDAVKQCGITWEILPMAYRWPCSTGYFHF